MGVWGWQCVFGLERKIKGCVEFNSLLVKLLINCVDQLSQII